MAGSQVLNALKKLYEQWLGELQWIETPPKTMIRRSRNRERFMAEQPARQARADEIRRGLPCIAYVIGVYDPDWRPDMAKPIRPSAKGTERQAVGPPQGWTAAAIDVLREADMPLSIAEIVEDICDRHGLESGDVADRQRHHTAVNNGLRRSHSDDLVCDDGTPKRWALKNRGLLS